MRNPSADLFSSVINHQAEFQHVTTTQGSYSFNQNFEAPEFEDTLAPKRLRAEIIDVVQRRDAKVAQFKNIKMMEQSWIEYVIKLSVNSNEMKIVNKRYSELGQFHQMLVDRKTMDLRGVTFPDKAVFHENWWKGQDKDPESPFVLQRKEALNTYLRKLFDLCPELVNAPVVMDFFELDELGYQRGASSTVAASQAADQHYSSSASSIAASQGNEASNEVLYDV